VIDGFVAEKAGWIEKSLRKMELRREENGAQERLPQEELERLAEQAADVLAEKVRYYAQQIGVTYGRITIRNQKTRWGSCSAKGNLNFNCLLMLAPEDVQDYVVVHELCHRKQMNHSRQFWSEVERILPDYKIRRQWLKDHGGALIARLS
jgi:predicted metal-dependent hydrolase